MSNDSSPSPNESPSSGSPPPSPPSGSPPPSGSSSSPPPSSPPPSPPSPPENNSGNSSPSPPPPSEESPASSPPPPSPTEGSSPSPPTEESSPSPPPPKGGNDNGNNNNNNNGTVNSPPPPVENRGGPKETPSQDFVPPPASLSPNQSSPPSSDGSSNSGKSSSNNNAGVIIGVVVAGGVLLLLMCVCIMCFRRKKKKGSSTPPYGWEGASNPQGNQYWQKPPQDHVVKISPTSGGWGQPPMAGSGEESGQQSGNQVTTSSSFAPSPSLALGFNKSTFSYEELAEATNKFDKSRMLGQGGFGYVYKGVLSNGKEVAVKSLKVGSGQGEREFSAEVEIISRVHHRHLVSLVGYCIAGGQRMLVYEFVPNDTLEYHLHKRGELDFPTRLRIALGSARGLGYLHEDCHPRIIHRDIKASNILLDENYEAMVADFGLAKLTSDTNSHVSTRVMGTFGYLAPEYASSGKLTEKSDVFSFGVMLLEIITGRRPVDPNMNYMEDSLVDWSRPLLAKALEGANNYHEFVDPRLEGNYDPQLMKRMVACAAASIRHSAKRRPKMSQIVRALEGDVSLDDLNHEGTKPGQGMMLSSSEGSDQYDTRAYSADLKKFRQMAFATQDFASSEYGGTTSEYGINPSTTSSDSSREMHSKKIP